MTKGTCMLFASVALLVGSLPGCTTFKRWSYEGIGRDQSQQPDEVIRVLAIAPGSHVADLGAGGGYFTFRLAEAAGPEGRVYAIDVDRGMVDYLKQRAEEEGNKTVQVILGAPDDSLLPPNSVDLVLTCNTYHHLTDRTAYFKRLKPALRSGGRVAVIDYNGKGFFGWFFGHATAPDVIRAEMERAGYRLEKEYGFLPSQSFLVFASERG